MNFNQITFRQRCNVRGRTNEKPNGFLHRLRYFLSSSSSSPLTSSCCVLPVVFVLFLFSYIFFVSVLYIAVLAGTAQHAGHYIRLARDLLRNSLANEIKFRGDVVLASHILQQEHIEFPRHFFFFFLSLSILFFFADARHRNGIKIIKNNLVLLKRKFLIILSNEQSKVMLSIL